MTTQTQYEHKKSIRTLLMAIILLLVGCTGTLATLEFINTAKTYRIIQASIHANHVIDKLIQSAVFWFRERGTVNFALESQDIASQETLARITDYRAKGDAAFEEAMLDKNELALVIPSDMLTAIERDYAALKAIRVQVDTYMQKPFADRPAEFSQVWVKAMAQATTSVQNLRFFIAQASSGTSGPLLNAQYMKHFAWLMADFAGRERGLVLLHIQQGISLHQDDLNLLGVHRGRVEAGRATLEKLSQISSPRLREALVQLEKAYFEDFEKTRADVYASSMGSKPYNVTPETWYKQATDAIDVLLDLQGPIAEETERVIADLERSVTINAIILGSIMTLCIIAMVGANAAIRKNVISPLFDLCTRMTQLANGDTQSPIPHTNNPTEMGQIAVRLAYFRDQIIDNKAKEEAERQEQIRKIQLQDTINGLVLNVSSACDQTSQKVQTAAAATTELSTTVTSISERLHKAVNVSRTAVEQVEAANKAAQDLKAASAEISDVVHLIQNIASRTNLLALNATIEASRAGDVGKGFAVVAGEVKNLAHQTDEAIGSVTQKIETLHAVAQKVVAANTHIESVIDELNRLNADIASAVEEQSAATNEIAYGMEQASQGVSDVQLNLTAIKGRISENVSKAA